MPSTSEHYRTRWIENINSFSDVFDGHIVFEEDVVKVDEDKCHFCNKTLKRWYEIEGIYGKRRVCSYCKFLFDFLKREKNTNPKNVIQKILYYINIMKKNGKYDIR